MYCGCVEELKIVFLTDDSKVVLSFSFDIFVFVLFSFANRVMLCSSKNLTKIVRRA